jgi:hypothetical protein
MGENLNMKSYSSSKTPYIVPEVNLYDLYHLRIFCVSKGGNRGGEGVEILVVHHVGELQQHGVNEYHKGSLFLKDDEETVSNVALSTRYHLRPSC